MIKIVHIQFKNKEALIMEIKLKIKISAIKNKPNKIYL